MAISASISSRTLVNRFLSYKAINYRCISTSKKNKDTVAVPPGSSSSTPVPDFSKPLENKNWVSYGWCNQNYYEDRFGTHMFLFGTVSVIFVWGSLFLCYYPDYKERDWHKREAFVRLRERELAGLPPIDMNYVDPATVPLPTEEELGDTEIVI